MAIKIATWNVNSLKVRLDHVLKWLAQYQPDILALQEIKMMNDQFPTAAFASLGYQSLVNGQKTYNGVAILAKTAMTEGLMDVHTDDQQRRVLATTIGKIRMINLYVPNGESISSSKYEYKLAWLNSLTKFLEQELANHEHIVVVGDFNIAPEPRDVYNPEAWEGHVLFSEPERNAFQGLIELGFTDSFRLFEQPEKSYSWWDYRQGAFRRNMGLRIDHILLNKQLVTKCQSCLIDKEPRRWDRPSDHTPVLVSLDSIEC